MVWRAGLESFEQGEQVADLKARLARMEQELLTVSRLVHDYETKLHNHARENKDLAKPSNGLSGVQCPASGKQHAQRRDLQTQG